MLKDICINLFWFLGCLCMISLIAEVILAPFRKRQKEKTKKKVMDRIDKAVDEIFNEAKKDTQK